MASPDLPTEADVFDAVSAIEPATAAQVQSHLGAPWPQRGTVRNRLNRLVDIGELIVDGHHPARYAVNHLSPAR